MALWASFCAPVLHVSCGFCLLEKRMAHADISLSLVVSCCLPLPLTLPPPLHGQQPTAMPTGFQCILPSPTRPFLPPRAVPLSMRRPNMWGDFRMPTIVGYRFQLHPGKRRLAASHPCHPLATRIPISMHDLPWCGSSAAWRWRWSVLWPCIFPKDQRMALSPPYQAHHTET